MLKKRYRIKKIKEFNYMFRNGKRYSNRCLTLIATKAYLPYSRFGISISNKIGSAVIRNKVKRRIRSAIYDYTVCNTLEKKNYIFVARPNIEHMSYTELKDSVFALFNKVKEWIY